MSNRYRLAQAPTGWPDSLPFRLRFSDGDYGIGDVFEHEFATPQDEWDNLESGLLELQPNTYKVVGESDVYETPPGETFEKALAMGQEAHLVDAGFIKRIEEKPEPEPSPKKKATAKKATE